MRLVPVPYRYLGAEQRYKKFDWIELEVIKHETDKRFETFRPVNLDEITIAGAEDDWGARKQLLLPLIHKTLCEYIANFRQKADDGDQYSAESLFVVKPEQITDFVIEAGDPTWKPEWEQLFAQEPLFAEMKMKPLDKVPFSFSYRFTCSSVTVQTPP